MITQKIRKDFLNYFKSKQHREVQSSLVVPHDDPTILFTNAGMNQFKDVFLGKSKRDYKRATTAQKCIRVGGKHNDLENVGHTSRHLTFFEMMGNFSFGDYFKKEAIAFAWEVSCNVLQFDPEKIWVSVFKDDDEAFSLWEKHLPSSRIVRFDEKENFWAMGDTGPCGPCTELLYDRGEKYSDATSPIYDPSGERYLEFWNLVFMEFNRQENAKLIPLPAQNVDTGAGLERLASLKMGVDSVFATDTFQTIIKKIEEVSNVKYDIENKKLAPAFHVISDHLRALSFAISDGAQPSNTDRGYVLRKILRRATRYGKMLGFEKPFMHKILPGLIESMGDAYPQLISFQTKISDILTVEEESFLKTLKRGGSLLNDIIEKSPKKISGEDAFKLKDTYGFPIEEILLIAKDNHVKVDLKIFNELEKQAKELSKKANKPKSEKFEKNIFSDFVKTHSPCKFEGYEKIASDSNIIAILKDDSFQDSINENETGIIILDKTPFYAEMGGQKGDIGKIELGDNTFLVENTLSPYPDVIIHIGKVTKGNFKRQNKVKASVEKTIRQKIENNHSATHLLHYALLKTLGEHATQSGSLVDDKRIRFDFSHQKALSDDEIKQIEKIVNQKIRENIKTKTYELSLESAQKDPSIKQIFGEKYLEKVRVVDFEISKELCGGCHTKQTGDIGFFKIIKESSIAAGIRRIEATTSEEAENFVYEKQAFIKYLENVLKTPEPKLIDRIDSLLKELKENTVQLKAFRKEKIKNIKLSSIKKLETINNIPALLEIVDLSSNELAPFAQDLLLDLKSAVVALAIKQDDKCQVVIKISSDITKKGIFANELIKQIAPIIQGGGGGSKETAQAGGIKKENLKQALEKLRSIIKAC